VRKGKEVARDLIEQTFYDPAKGKYLVKNHEGRWDDWNETAVRRKLRQAGLSSLPPRDGSLSEVEEALLTIQEEQAVDYSGPLAGREKGFFRFNGVRVLVTSDAPLVVPEAASFPVIDEIFAGLLVNDVDQRPYLFGWLKIALQALNARKLRPGQCVVFAGPANCGKSLVQHIIGLLLGGRTAAPYRYMSGGTQFNSELFGAEHLAIEDEAPFTDIRARRALGAQIKNMTVNTLHSCHPKGRPALSLAPFWRLTISVNDEPEFLMTLPPMDESIADKITLFKCQHQAMPMPTATTDEREQFMTAIQTELPAFVYWLLNIFEVPEEIRCHRFGVKHFHHPQVLGALELLAPESRLWDLIQTYAFDRSFAVTAWSGKARELERLLTSHDDCSYDARKLLTNVTAVGRYLSRLSVRYPKLISSRLLHGETIWTIKREAQGGGVDSNQEDERAAA
jgi:hypothetical protein